MKILHLGKNGQLGWDHQRSLAPLGDLIELDRLSQDLCGDLGKLPRRADTVRALRPYLNVNAAAHADVDKAESEPELARTNNALAPGMLAQETDKLGAWLVHYSTDCVFDGSGSRPWVETDKPAPMGVFVCTKLEGKQRVAEHCQQNLMFLTGWVYAARGGNFAKTMLRLAQEHEKLNVIYDQFGIPGSAELIADVTAHVICPVLQRLQNAGLYHLAANGERT